MNKSSLKLNHYCKILGGIVGIAAAIWIFQLAIFFYNYGNSAQANQAVSYLTSQPGYQVPLSPDRVDGVMAQWGQVAWMPYIVIGCVILIASLYLIYEGANRR